MITDAILGFFFQLLSPLVSALPQGHLPTGWNTAANGISSWLWSLDAVVPVGAPLVFLMGVVIATVPAFLTFRVGVWIYNKVRGA